MWNPCGCNYNLGVTCELHVLAWRVSEGKASASERERLAYLQEAYRKAFGGKL